VNLKASVADFCREQGSSSRALLRDGTEAGTRQESPKRQDPSGKRGIVAAWQNCPAFAAAFTDLVGVT
jgi:hypothetical protein